MLNFLRKKQNMKIIFWIIVVVVIVTFVFGFGPGRFLRRSAKKYPKYAGVIFGKKMSLERYAESWRACYHEALMVYGQELSKVIDYLNLEEQAWNRLILLKEADKRKTKITDEEVMEKIKNLPVFQENGQFDEKRYKFILGYYFKTDPRTFEEEIRQSIKISKLIEEAIKDVTITDEELEKIYKEENEQVRVAYLLVKPESFKDKVEIVESEIKNFYQENKKEFQIPPRVNIEYLPLTTKITKDKVVVSEEELKSYYQNNKELFKKQLKAEKENDKNDNEKTEYKSYEEVKEDIENILLNAKGKEMALDIALEVLQKIKGGADFKKVSSEYSLEIKETGFFSAMDSIPEIGWSYNFLNTAFNLKAGEVSDIIDLPDGYYILRCKDKKDSYVPEYEEIKDKIKQAYIKEKSLSLAQTKAKEYQEFIKDKIQQGKSLEEASQLLSLEVQITEYFTRYDYVPGIGKSDEFTQSAFSLKEKEISNVIRAPKGYCILSLEEFKPINEEEFLKNKEEFKKKALEVKKVETYQVWFENLKKEASLKSFI